METKTIFNLYLTYEEALQSAKDFQSAHKTFEGKDLHIWEDPRGFYNERITFRLDGFFKESEFYNDLKDCEFEAGNIDEEAKAMLFWLIDRHKGFNPLELNQVIVGTVNSGIEGDKEVAVFTYLSKEDDCLRGFISEKAFRLVANK